MLCCASFFHFCFRKKFLAFPRTQQLRPPAANVRCGISSSTCFSAWWSRASLTSAASACITTWWSRGVRDVSREPDGANAPSADHRYGRRVCQLFIPFRAIDGAEPQIVWFGPRLASCINLQNHAQDGRLRFKRISKRGGHRKPSQLAAARLLTGLWSQIRSRQGDNQHFGR